MTDFSPALSIEQLATLVAANDYALTGKTFHAIRDFFLTLARQPDYAALLARLAPEFGRDEFLTCVDDLGAPRSIPTKTLSDFRETQAAHPRFAAWFQEAPGGVLLPSRWLCHMTGLRHKTVHLFIDPPALPDTTLIQVRATDRPESPGCFDLAVAGHVSDTLSESEALYREMGEELGLSPHAVTDVMRINGYAHVSENTPPFRNAEYHAVYRCRLTLAGWAAVRTSEEVAAIALFSTAELARLMTLHPERFAPGIKDSYKFYLAAAKN
jgi:isopentenyl-diphosphate Delta-isomerase